MMQHTSHVNVGVIAPSSMVSMPELQAGVEVLNKHGVEVKVHPQCREQHLFFAGKDELRAKAFWEFASHSDFSVLWCARGGYGAQRIIPFLEEWSRQEGIPQPKLLVGYSDATALMEYVRSRWSWNILHAPMPGKKEFIDQTPRELSTLMNWVKGLKAPPAWEGETFRFLGQRKPDIPLRAPVVGGNLSVWASLIGTHFEPLCDQKRFLFFEEVGEPLGRIDRMVQQLFQSGALQNVRGLLLGSFHQCEDHVPQAWVTQPKPSNFQKDRDEPTSPQSKGPIRKPVLLRQFLAETFGQLGNDLGVPVLYGLPMGHGNQQAALPLGAEISLTPQGELQLSHWSHLTGG